MIQRLTQRLTQGTNRTAAAQYPNTLAVRQFNGSRTRAFEQPTNPDKLYANSIAAVNTTATTITPIIILTAPTLCTTPARTVKRLNARAKPNRGRPHASPFSSPQYELTGQLVIISRSLHFRGEGTSESQTPPGFFFFPPYRP